MVFLAVTVMVGLAGCGSSGANRSSENGVVHLTIMTHYSQQQATELEKYINEWNKEHPKIQVKHISIADFTQLLPTIMAKQTSGQQPDILHVYSLWGGQLAENHVFAMPPKEIRESIKKDYPTAAVKGSTVNGKLLGYPSEVETYALYYNKKLLKEAGFTHPPKTWDELYHMAKTITKRDRSGKLEVEGFGLKPSNDASGVVHPYLALLHSAGGYFINDKGTKTGLDSKAGLKTLQFQQKFIHNKVTDTSVEIPKAFPSEKVAMVIGAGWWQGSLKAIMQDKYKDIGIAPIPSPDGKKKGTVSYSYFYGVDSKSPHKKEAWQFLKWLNEKAQKNGATAEGNFLLSQGIIPSRKPDIKILHKELAAPNNQPFIDALNYATPEPNPLGGEKIKTLLQSELESSWSGEETPKQAIRTASKRVDNELRR